MTQRARMRPVPGKSISRSRIDLHPRAVALAVSAALAAAPLAYAADASAPAKDPSALEDIVVTAQKRTENLQDVPLSIQALGTEKLEELHIQNLDDYVKFLPTVSYVRSQGQGGNGQPGTSHVYMRGVVSGGDGNHSGSLPSVGIYLDEQPVTTIDGSLDIHVYDIERVEVLAGPQGTLYGASSESGTIRIISNKPDPTKFSAAVDVQANKVQHGGIGHVEEAYVNVPIASNVAIRLVGWNEHDAGFISNIPGTNISAGFKDGVRTFPTWNSPPPLGVGTGAFPGTVGAGAISNAAYVKDKYNTVDVSGGRAALKVDLFDSWTITPTIMAQDTQTKGFFGFDPSLGDLKVTHFGPEHSKDSFAQSALTVEGRVHDFDIVYAGAWMKRDAHSVADYSDYSFFYDKLHGSGAYFLDNAGKVIDPVQLIYGDDWYSKLSHEIRVSTPKSYPVKATVGAFAQRQVHEIYQNYLVPGFGGDGLATSLSVPGWSQTLWLTDEERVDKDRAVFAQATWDINPHWGLTGGWRQFWYDNSLQGFYGFNANFSGHQGTATCGPPGSTVGNPTYAPFHGAPCTDLNGDTKGSGHVPLLTLTYFGDDDAMIYATASKGFRPGGVNRARNPGSSSVIPPYAAEYLLNYELGWKSRWANRHVRWNGAFFAERWNDFQFSYLVPPNSLTAVSNAGKAAINGVESEVEWAAGGGVSLSANATYIDGKLTQDYCDGGCAPHTIPGASGTLWAAEGTRLPVAPHFKGNLIFRYAFSTDSWKGNFQFDFTTQTDSTATLKTAQSNALGVQPGYSSYGVSGGASRGGFSWEVFVSNLLDKRAEITRFAECDPVAACSQIYSIPTQPRTFGIKLGQKF